MKYQLADTTGFPEVKDTMDYEDAGNVVVPLTLESNVRILHQYLFGEDGYTPSSTLSAINSELESISQNGSMGTTDSSILIIMTDILIIAAKVMMDQIKVMVMELTMMIVQHMIRANGL